MTFSRRKFIVSSILSTVGITVFSSPLSYPVTFLNSLSNPDIDTLLSQAASARSSGNFTLSESLYNQVIQLAPYEVRAYFGLRKTFLSQKHKEYNVVRLFEQAVQSNSENVQLICQLAKEYTSIALGNKQVEQMLDYETPLLEKAKDLYLVAQSFSPTLFARGGDTESDGENSQAEVGLNKVESKIEQQADKIDARDSASLKNQRKTYRVNYKKRFDLKSDDELLSKLNILKAKPQPQIRAKHIKELYVLNIKRKKKSNDFIGACALAYQLHQFDLNDTFFLGLYKRSALQAKQYNQLITVLKSNDTRQSTYWSKIAYFDALKLRFDLGQPGISDINTMQSILNSLENPNLFKLSPYMIQEIGFRRISLNLSINNYSNTETALLNQVKKLVGSTNAHASVRFCRYLASYFKLIGQNSVGIKLINNFISPDTITENDVNGELQRLVYEYSRNIVVEKQVHFEQLYQIRNSLNG